MAEESMNKPVEDSIGRVNEEVAVGEDLDFQRRWWRFESIAWAIFTLIIVLDLAGVFGRGPVANAERRTVDGSIDVKYERIERSNSPSIMTVNFGPAAVRNGNVKLYVSNSLVKALGTQRVIPAPQDSVVGAGGITYTFPVSKPPASVDLALQPAGPGIFEFVVGVEGEQQLREKIAVVP